MPNAAKAFTATDLTPKGVERAFACALSADAVDVCASARAIHTFGNLWERRRGS